MRNEYTISEAIKLFYSLVITKLFYRNARLIRQPFYIRGKSSMKSGHKLTTGYNCRFDLPGNNKKTLFIGKNCEIGDNVHFVAHEKLIIGDNVLMASKIFISDTNHGDYSGSKQSSPSTPPNSRSLTTKPVIIGDNVWIGENVCILPGVTIGEGSIIGANSVVNKDISANCIAVGVPAKVVKKYDSAKAGWLK
ncbi:MAG: CpsI [Fusobacteria bacterium]|nr:MAG: CpsI [Fusobacteriota bacterium]KAF0229261.1 MAG: hypothetical protein FD182_1517 [Fusobacteriota bacterium]